MIICDICGCDIERDEAVACTACGTPSHEDCWCYNGRCGIYGCGGSECGPYEPTEAAPLVTIDETTRPPLRIEPAVEALLRRLPGWSRRLAVPLAFGVATPLAALGVGVALLGTFPPLKLISVLIASGIAMSLLAALTGRRVRRSPLTMAFVFAAVGFVSLVVLAITFRNRWLGACMAFVFVALTGSAVAERVCGWLRGRGRVLGAAARSVVTGLFIVASILTMGMMLGKTITTGVLLRVFIYSLFGVAAAAPAMESAKSALVHRLEAEAARKDAIARQDPPGHRP